MEEIIKQIHLPYCKSLTQIGVGQTGKELPVPLFPHIRRIGHHQIKAALTAVHLGKQHGPADAGRRTLPSHLPVLLLARKPEGAGNGLLGALHFPEIPVFLAPFRLFILPLKLSQQGVIILLRRGGQGGLQGGVFHPALPPRFPVGVIHRDLGLQPVRQTISPKHRQKFRQRAIFLRQINRQQQPPTGKPHRQSVNIRPADRVLGGMAIKGGGFLGGTHQAPKLGNGFQQGHAKRPAAHAGVCRRDLGQSSVNLFSTALHPFQQRRRCRQKGLAVRQLFAEKAEIVAILRRKGGMFFQISRQSPAAEVIHHRGRCKVQPLPICFFQRKQPLQHRTQIIGVHRPKPGIGLGRIPVKGQSGQLFQKAVALSIVKQAVGQH